MDPIEILEQKAIDAAINSEWEYAITHNESILKTDKKNIDALLRLGFAFIQVEKMDQAKIYYKRALRLQPSNRVAKENLERISILEIKKGNGNMGKNISLDPSLFLEIPGKTKSVILVNPGQKNILAQLMVGQEILMKSKKRRIEARTKGNEYVGSLPDDVSKRLIIFLKAGSEFGAYIKEANLNRVVIFIKEEKKGARVTRYTSFPRDIQSNLDEISQEEEVKESDDGEITENDLDRLAEDLTNEEKEYIPFHTDNQDEDEEE